jgi:hypothetical protein
MVLLIRQVSRRKGNLCTSHQRFVILACAVRYSPFFSALHPSLGPDSTFSQLYTRNDVDPTMEPCTRPDAHMQQPKAPVLVTIQFVVHTTHISYHQFLNEKGRKRKNG